MDQEAQPGRRPSMREWLGAWRDDGADVPEVGRDGGRILSGTTGELAACLQHIAGCPSCSARWPRTGYAAMELAGDHVAFTVEEKKPPRRRFSGELRAAYSKNGFDPDEAEERADAVLRATQEGEPKASRSCGTLLDAANRVARLVGVPEATSHQHATPHLIKVLVAAAEALEWIESYT